MARRLGQTNKHGGDLRNDDVIKKRLFVESVRHWRQFEKRNTRKMERKKSLFSSLSDRSYGLRQRADIRRSILGIIKVNCLFLDWRMSCFHYFLDFCLVMVVWRNAFNDVSVNLLNIAKAR